MRGRGASGPHARDGEPLLPQIVADDEAFEAAPEDALPAVGEHAHLDIESDAEAVSECLERPSCEEAECLTSDADVAGVVTNQKAILTAGLSNREERRKAAASIATAETYRTRAGSFRSTFPS
jgi:hypothetical protein